MVFPIQHLNLEPRFAWFVVLVLDVFIFTSSTSWCLIAGCGEVGSCCIFCMYPVLFTCSEVRGYAFRFPVNMFVGRELFLIFPVSVPRAGMENRKQQQSVSQRRSSVCDSFFLGGDQVLEMEPSASRCLEKEQNNPSPPPPHPPFITRRHRCRSCTPQKGIKLLDCWIIIKHRR